MTTYSDVHAVERGWPGQFITYGLLPIYHRNTLLYAYGDRFIVVSTIGNMHMTAYGDISEVKPVEGNIWYQTKVFFAEYTGSYIESGEEIKGIPWKNTIESSAFGKLPPDVDTDADDMHDSIVEYVKQHYDELLPEVKL